MLKRIRVALLAIALFLGSLAAAGALKVVHPNPEGWNGPLVLAQSAGPGEVWHAYVRVAVEHEGQSGWGLLSPDKTFAEQPECNSVLVMTAMQLSMSGQDVIDAWCSTMSPEDTIKELVAKESEQPT